MNEQLAALENKLNDVLVKKAPFQLPAGLKKFVGDYGWIFVLVGVIFGVIATIGLLGVIGLVGGLVVLGGGGLALALAWLSLAVIVVQTGLQAMAIMPLKERKKSGWDLLFYSMLVGVAAAVVDFLYKLSQGGAEAAGAVFGVFFSVAFTVLWFYILFQVRSEFVGSKHVEKVAESSKAPKA